MDADGLGVMDKEDALDIIKFVGVKGNDEQLNGFVLQLNLAYLDVLSATNQNAVACLGVGSRATVSPFASACQRRLRKYVGEHY